MSLYGYICGMERAGFIGFAGCEILWIVWRIIRRSILGNNRIGMKEMKCHLMQQIFEVHQSKTHFSMAAHLEEAQMLHKRVFHKYYSQGREDNLRDL